MAEVIIDQIETMLKLEVVYGTVDYMDYDFQKSLSKKEESIVALDSLFKDDASLVSSSSSSSSNSNSGMKERFREQIVEWAYQVVDHFDLEREVVSHTMNFLDRYLAKQFVTSRMFQLLAMTALSLAIKLNERTNLPMKSLVLLSRGNFSVKQVEIMEMSLMTALGWQLHPPTSFAFTKQVISLLPQPCMSPDVRHSLLELARFLNELTVIDYFFVTYRPSHVAVAAIANAMQEVAVTHETIYSFMQVMYSFHNIDIEDPAISECRERIRILYAQGGYTTSVIQSSQDRPETAPSPVCITYGTDAYQYQPSNAPQGSATSSSYYANKSGAASSSPTLE